jgi:DNA-binding NarL/FixJ family response regulator
MKAIRLLIVDDIDQVRQDLRTVLTLAGDIDVVGEAANGLEAIRQVEALKPDVVLLDLEMPVLNGYEAADQIRRLCPACRVIALSVHDYKAARQKAIQAGIEAFVTKGAPVGSLVQAILDRRE